ncbi:MAG: sterol desaturase family protein [Cyclobacteriaceae bacterium]|nr:sterol desaturase family protein [Cyclobacteriaceae bacterium]
MKAKFVSNSHESSRMFKSGLLESLSKVHFSVPLFVFVPVIGYFLYQAIVNQTNWVTTLISIAAGLAFWTLTEYVLHRFIFHFEPQSKWGQRIHFIFHGVHHDYPNDALRLVMPPSVSIPLATGFYFLFKFVLPENYLNGFFAAFLIGYLFYDISHYALHHGNFKSNFWKKLKNHHMQHHYVDATKGYGVSSALWDKILHSDFNKDAN